MAYSAYLPAYAPLPGLTNAQVRLQQQQELEAAAQLRYQQTYGQGQYGQPQAYGYTNPEYAYAAQQGYVQTSQYRPQQQYIIPPAQYTNQAYGYSAQPYGSSRTLSSTNLVTAVGPSTRQIGNGTTGNLEEHRNAIHSVYFIDRAYNQF